MPKFLWPLLCMKWQSEMGCCQNLNHFALKLQWNYHCWHPGSFMERREQGEGGYLLTFRLLSWKTPSPNTRKKKIKESKKNHLGLLVGVCTVNATKHMIKKPQEARPSCVWESTAFLRSWCFLGMWIGLNFETTVVWWNWICLWFCWWCKCLILLCMNCDSLLSLEKQISAWSALINYRTIILSLIPSANTNPRDSELVRSMGP